jgi:hypothetical protein
VGCIHIVVAMAVITENVCMSRGWKDELVIYGIRIQPLPRITHLLLLKHDRSPVCPVCLESVPFSCYYVEK